MSKNASLPGRHQGRRAGASQRSHPWPRMVEADRRHEFDDNPFTLPADLELSVEDASGSRLFARSPGAPVGLQRSIALAQRSDESTTLSRRSSPFALPFSAINSASVQIASHASALTTSTAVLLRESKYKVVWRQGHEVGAEFVSVVRSGFALQN